jgi:hypothetical protein
MLVLLSLNIVQLINKPYKKIKPATSVNSDVVGFFGLLFSKPNVPQGPTSMKIIYTYL